MIKIAPHLPSIKEFPLEMAYPSLFAYGLGREYNSHGSPPLDPNSAPVRKENPRRAGADRIILERVFSVIANPSVGAFPAWAIVYSHLHFDGGVG